MAALRERLPSYTECDSDDWWEKGNEERAGSLVTRAVTIINENQKWRLTAAQRFASYYAGHPDGAGVVSGGPMAGRPTTVVRNVCAQAVKTVVPKAAKHRPLPKVQTNAGEWKDSKRARKMTQYLEGIFKKKQIFDVHWDQMFFDAAVMGDGNLKIEPRGKGINVERVFWWEYLIDAADGRDGKPRNSYHVHTMDLGRAIAIYGKKRKGEREADAAARRDALRSAAVSVPDPNWDLADQQSSTVKRVRLVHAWHICDDEEAHTEGILPEKHECNGRTVTAILGNEECLEFAPWDWPEDPVHSLVWERPLAGVRGIGLVRRLEGWQERITTQTDTVDDAHRIGGRALVMTPTGSNLIAEEISNESPICIVTYDGPAPPQPTVMPTCDPSLAQREAQLPQDALNENGISMQSAAGQKHPGVNAGIAIEQLDEIEDEHWVPLGHAAEAVALRMSRSFIRCMIRIAKEHGEDSTLVQVKMRDGFVKLRWSDVSLNDFQVEVFPSSVLPQRPANRLEKLRSMFLDGLIDRQTFLQQLGAPDLTAEIDLITAGRVIIDEMIEGILDAENDNDIALATTAAMPNSYIDFKWMQVRAQQKLLKAKMDRAPENVLQALQDVCDACETMKEEEKAKMAAQAPAPADPMAAAMGGAMGAPPPEAGPPMGGPPGMTPPPGMGLGGPPMGGAPPPDMMPMMGAA